MPAYKGVTIKVTTQEGVELDEYGLKSMTRRNFCSAYVQSETDVSFKISLTPDISFFEEGCHESPGSCPSRRISRPNRYHHRHRNRSSSPSGDDYMSESDEWDSRDYNHSKLLCLILLMNFPSYVSWLQHPLTNDQNHRSEERQDSISLQLFTLMVVLNTNAELLF